MPLILSKEVWKCAKISKNWALPKISDKKSSTGIIEKFHQWRNLRRKFCFRFWASSSSRDETWKDFSVEANLRFTDNQFDGIYLFIKWLISWSKTIYVRTSCWSSHWLTMVQSSQLESNLFQLWSVLVSARTSESAMSSTVRVGRAIDAFVLALNQYVTVECNQSNFYD